MDKKDFKNACMVAGGTAIAAASGAAMHVSSVSVPTELLSDLALFNNNLKDNRLTKVIKLYSMGISGVKRRP